MEINAEVFEQCSANFKKSRQGYEARFSSGQFLSEPLFSFPTRSEKAKQKAREENWQHLREAALRNKDSSTPLPASLLSSVAPEGTYNPLRDQEDLNESSFGEMEDDQGTLGIVQSPSVEGFMAGEHAMESDDGHGDLVRFVGTGYSSRDFGAHPALSCAQPDQFPETARRQVPVPGSNQQPHVRRKSVIPLDASILRELASHKSCVVTVRFVCQARVLIPLANPSPARLDDGPLTGQPRGGGAGPGRG